MPIGWIITAAVLAAAIATAAPFAVFCNNSLLKSAANSSASHDTAHCGTITMLSSESESMPPPASASPAAPSSPSSPSRSPHLSPSVAAAAAAAAAAASTKASRTNLEAHLTHSASEGPVHPPLQLDEHTAQKTLLDEGSATVYWDEASQLSTQPPVAISVWFKQLAQSVLVGPLHPPLHWLLQRRQVWPGPAYSPTGQKSTHAPDTARRTAHVSQSDAVGPEHRRCPIISAGPQFSWHSTQ